MAAHSCETCGLLHDMPAAETAESDEVKIARINREADVKIAQLQARQDREWNESREEVAKIEAKADVEVAEVEAEIIGDAIEAAATPEEAAEIVLPDPPEEETEEAVEDAPPEAGSPVPEPAGSRKRGLGMW